MKWFQNGVSLAGFRQKSSITKYLLTRWLPSNIFHQNISSHLLASIKNSPSKNLFSIAGFVQFCHITSSRRAGKGGATFLNLFSISACVYSCARKQTKHTGEARGAEGHT